MEEIRSRTIITVQPGEIEKPIAYASMVCLNLFKGRKDNAPQASCVKGMTMSKEI
jgi:hypothetical protein